jgi:hypothetical protein
MNSQSTGMPATALETLEGRFALRVASRLSEGADAVGGDIAERLRFSREKALDHARVAAQTQRNTGEVRSGSALALLGGGPSWWVKLGSVLPLVVLIAGLALIDHWHASAQVATAAEIDTALLADDLPPGAYSDAGFVEFLKAPRD